MDSVPAFPMRAMPAAVHQLLSPVDAGSMPPSDLLQIALWVAAVSTRDGKHTSGMAPLGERYQDTEEGYRIYSDVAVHYCPGIEARTKVLKVLELSSHQVPKGRQSHEITRTLLVTYDGRFLIETVTFGPAKKIWIKGETHHQRVALDCQVSDDLRVLEQALVMEPDLLASIVATLESQAKAQITALETRMRRAEHKHTELQAIRRRLRSY